MQNRIVFLCITKISSFESNISYTCYIQATAKTKKYYFFRNAIRRSKLFAYVTSKFQTLCNCYRHVYDAVPYGGNKESIDHYSCYAL